MPPYSPCHSPPAPQTAPAVRPRPFSPMASPRASTAPDSTQLRCNACPDTTCNGCHETKQRCCAPTRKKKNCARFLSKGTLSDGVAGDVEGAFFGVGLRAEAPLGDGGQVAGESFDRGTHFEWSEPALRDGFDSACGAQQIAGDRAGGVDRKST